MYSKFGEIRSQLCFICVCACGLEEADPQDLYSRRTPVAALFALTERHPPHPQRSNCNLKKKKRRAFLKTVFHIVDRLILTG